jgi:peptidoglycan/LPS O-acetylase OafA/YrhL
MESGVGEVPSVDIRRGVDRTKRELRSAIIFMCVAGLLLAYLTAASHAPWPVEGAAGFVWGAGLVAVAIGYVLKNRDQLSATGVARGLALAIVGFLLPAVLNQLINSEELHRLHKLLAFVSAFVVFVAWITELKNRTPRRSSTR